jgi:peroxiredoxin Q/BCP
VESHLDFSETLKLNFSLLADVDKKASKSYQVLTELGVIAYSSRETFIIDPDGRIAYHFDDVTPDTHTKIVLKKLDELLEIYQ